MTNVSLSFDIPAEVVAVLSFVANVAISLFTYWCMKKAEMFNRTNHLVKGLVKKFVVIFGGAYKEVCHLEDVTRNFSEDNQLPEKTASDIIDHAFSEQAFKTADIDTSDYLFAFGEQAVEKLRRLSKLFEEIHCMGNDSRRIVILDLRPKLKLVCTTWDEIVEIFAKAVEMKPELLRAEMVEWAELQ